MRPEYLGEPGRKAPAWRCPLVGVQPRSRLQHARVPPLAYPSADASIPDSLRETLPQMAPGPVVERPNTLIPLSTTHW